MSVLDRGQPDQTRFRRRSYFPLVFYAAMPPLPRPVRKVGAPLAAIIAMGTLAGLILLLAGSADPVGITRGFVLATIATTLVVLCYLWLDRWEPEPPRLLVMAFLWGASVAVLFSMVFSVLFDHLLGTTDSGVDGNPGLLMGAVVGPAVEEAFKGLFLVLMMTGRRRNELNTLTDCLVYAGLTAVGFAWLENIFYLGSAETLQGSLAIDGLRLVISTLDHPFFNYMIAIVLYFALK